MRQSSLWLSALAVLVGLVLGWSAPDPAVLVGVSMVSALYLALAAPTWCGAVTRDGTPCRNNSSGLFFGCWLRQHKYQRLKLAFASDRWERLRRELFDGPAKSLASIATLVSVLSALIGLVRLPFG